MIDPQTWFNFTIKKNGDDFSATLTCQAALPYFEGHFPDQPVLPAVAVIDATKMLAESAVPGLDFTGVESAKFSGPIYPGMDMTVLASRHGAGSWIFRWTHDDQILAELRLLCG